MTDPVTLGSSRILLAGRGSRILPILAAQLDAEGALISVADPSSPADMVLPPRTAVVAGSPAELVGVATTLLGGLDVLVCHSDAGTTGPLRHLDPADARRDLERLVGDAYELSILAGRAMHGGGVIVHVVGVDALHAYPGRSVAAVAMPAIGGLVRALAVELAGASIRAVGVVYGPLDGGATGPPSSPPSGLVDRTRLRFPTGRFVAGHDVAAAIRFVASSRASFMTGQTVRVDGGWGSLNQAPSGMRFP